jgi:hypothetical protein
MGIEKSEIKAGTMTAYAADLDDLIKAAENDVQKLDGAATALKACGKNIEGVMVAFRQSMEAEDFKVPEDPAALAKLVMAWLRRAHGVTISMADQNTAQGLQVQGRIQGVSVAKKRADAIVAQEKGKAEALRAAEDRKVVDIATKRPVGSHPGRSQAADRKAAQAAQEAPEGPGAPEAGAQATAEAEAPVKPPRRRKKKAAEKGEEAPKPRTRRRKKKAE